MPLGTERVILVARDITEARKHEELLRASLAEKAVLLREVHHRVKNNMQVMSSIVSLQESSFQTEADRELSRDMQTRVQSMAHLHELLYCSKDLASIDAAEYLNAIAGELSLNHGKSLIRMDAQSDILSIDEAMPFGLIANELMTNALKYAYPQANLDSAGKIYVSYNRSGVERVLEVRDEGVGLPPDFDLENSVSMGFILVRTLAEQIGGKLSISEAKPGDPSPGLRVVLVFSSAPRTQ